MAFAFDVQLAVLELKELDDRDFPRLSELTFLVLLVAVLLQSEITIFYAVLSVNLVMSY